MIDSLLGKSVPTPQHYQPDLLMPIARAANRETLGLTGTELPFKGADIWNAWELSCLGARGKPETYIGRFIFPAESENLVESKSLKLYLTSLNQETYTEPGDFAGVIRSDLSRAAGVQVEVGLYSPQLMGMPEIPAGTCLDNLDIEVEDYRVSQDLLIPAEDALFEEITEEVLYTNLFRSNCPITGQPDWATVTVCYRGRQIPHEQLLKYLVSYRLHNDYHENCVERIFCDLTAVYKPDALTVEANFLRRGGLDINPVRTTETGLNYQDFPRYIRQ